MLEVRWLSKVAYRDAYTLQHGLFDSGKAQHLLLLEHNHVYTLGVRADISNILVDPKQVGAEMVRVDRGGDVTYHGPGQLVGYTILDVATEQNSTPNFVAKIEDLIIATLDKFSIVGQRNPGFPGVWTISKDGSLRKIAAIGVRISRGRSMHGFALNVTTDLEMFSNIVPCGISEYGVTSMQAEGSVCQVEDVVGVVASLAPKIFGFSEASFYGASSSDGYSMQDPNLVDSIIKVAPKVDAMAESRSLDRRLASAGVGTAEGISISKTKPEWIKLRTKMGSEYQELKETMRGLNLVTVCEEAGCPNIYECWSQGTATFMINGEDCTRACGFCLVKTDRPLPLDLDEPRRVALAVEKMGLDFAVVTAVARDDLSDGGAIGFVETINQIRRLGRDIGVEVLISDCKGDEDALSAIYKAAPDVLNHNIETVLRLQRAVRPQASYARSLSVLSGAVKAGLVTKSGIIVGMGETMDELKATLRDLASVGVSIVTIGQYLRPTRKHLPVSKWYTPKEFAELKSYGEALGIRHVESSPNTRSSYHAKEAGLGIKV
ncbi:MULTISPECIES: lipoyl synthase [Acidithrix]|uniref:Multifunctional fusion protein n=2 Tax=root TaxID=1 RepID=A0A0D8HKB3_9ACTN|nr:MULTISPECIES: lipoyl synthase [Acidithrix]KJF18390.1 lipoyl synthase [Acidithrix ferrooxidans]CAG4920481.1 unnamed protein product [Acidithrix sp. C25]